MHTVKGKQDGQRKPETHFSQSKTADSLKFFLAGMYAEAESSLREAAFHVSSPIEAVKILHNFFLVRYYCSGGQSSEKLLQQWTALASAFPLSLPSLSSASVLPFFDALPLLQRRLATMSMKCLSPPKFSGKFKEPVSTISLTLKNSKNDAYVDEDSAVITYLKSVLSIEDLSTLSVNKVMTQFLATEENLELLQHSLSHCFRQHLSANEGLPWRDYESVALLLYNLSLLHYQNRQYETAVYLLEDIFIHIEQLDKFLAVKLCILLMELYMKLHQLEFVYLILSYFKKRKDVFFQWETEASVQPFPVPSSLMGEFFPMDRKTPKGIFANEFQYILSMFTVRLALSQKQIKNAKREMKLLQKVPSFSNRAKERERLASMDATEDKVSENSLQTDETLEFSSFPSAISSSMKNLVTLFQYAFQQYYTTTALLLHANLELHRRNGRKAAKILIGCFLAAESAEKDGNSTKELSFANTMTAMGGNEILFYNNLGCIYFTMMKPSLASFYFMKAFKAISRIQASNQILSKENAFPGGFFKNVEHHFQSEILYNIGLQALLKNKINEAFLCFEEVSHSFPKHPRLWIRLAECCILLYEKWKMKQRKEEPNQFDSVYNQEVFTSVLNNDSSAAMAFHSTVVSDTSIIFPMFRHYLTPSVSKQISNKRNEPSARELQETSVSIDAGYLTGQALLAHLQQFGYEALTYAKLCLDAVLFLIQRRQEQLASLSAGAGPSPTSTEVSIGTIASSSAKTQPPLSLHATEAANSLDSFYNIYLEELGVYEDTARLKLAYVCLCQEDYGASLSFCLPILQKNGILSKAEFTKMTIIAFEKKVDTVGCTYTSSSVFSLYLAYTYALESFLRLGMINNASILMENYAEKNILEKSFGLSYPTVGPSTPTKVASLKKGAEKKALSVDEQEKNSTILGFSLPSSFYPLHFIPLTGFSFLQIKCMMHTNIAYFRIVLQDIPSAYAAIQEAIKALPSAIVPSRTLLYILIAQGKHGEAVKFLRKMRFQRAT